ncbi:MAG: hypothetical protein EU549_00120 [Promethearchaeota archaeon]|nr:MAG: hypothetical protein EU549_00120 [Candidatus Lokiarchaeota archaeon]
MKMEDMDLRFTEEDIVYISKYFNRELIAEGPIRKKQDNVFVNKIRKKAIDKMNGGPKIKESNLFYIGSADFMVTENNGNREFVILELNGGSSRGYLSLTHAQTKMLFNAYKEAIDNYKSESKTKIVLIATLPNDGLLQEKIMMIEYLRQCFEKDGQKVGIFNTSSFELSDNINIHIILSDYNLLLKHLTYKNNYIQFKGVNLDIIIGDGVARRFSIIDDDVKSNWKNINTLIINFIYHITDDKSSSYLAMRFGQDILKKYRIKHLQFAKAFNQAQMEEYLTRIITEFKKNYIIKPCGGSGGAGIQPITSKTTINDIQGILNKSKAEFHEKFNKNRICYPYTIQEMADFSLIDYKNSKRTFDIRIYVVQKKGRIVPVGGVARIARLPYHGDLKKEEFVVNITGYKGPEVERGLGFSKKSLKKLNMTEKDLIDIFCASCEIFNICAANFMKIISFNEWDKLLHSEN